MPSPTYVLLRLLPFGLLLTLLFDATFAMAADPFRETVLPFVKTYCLECHNQKKPEGELDLTRYSSAEAVAQDS